MGDGNVVTFDETSPLTQSHGNILFYQPRLEDTTTLLVELPEVEIDAPRPTTHLSSRPRRSTIVDIQQASVSKEAELDPLQEYVRRNLSSFRRSIVPEDVPNLTRGWKSEEGELVNFATAEDTERDMDSKKQKTRDMAGSDDTNRGGNKREEQPYRRRHSSEEKKRKSKDSNTSDWPLELKVKKHNDSKNYEDFTRDRPEKMKSKHQKHGDRQPQIRSEVVVMPALEPVSVDHKSPFIKEQQELNKQSSLPIKIKLSVEPSEEETSNNDKRGDRHHSKRDKSDKRNRGENQDRRRKSRDASNDFFEEDKPTKNHKKRKSLRKSDDLSLNPREDVEERRVKNKTSPRKVRQESSSDGKRVRRKSRDSSGRSSQDDERMRRKSYDKRSSSSVCLSGASDGNTSEPNIINKPQKEESARRKHRSFGERSLSRDGNKSPRSSAAKNRDIVNLVDHSKTEHPFGKEENYAVHYVATEGKNKKAGVGSEKAPGTERDVDPNKQKYMTAKAPRSATKIVARRRYHIQIPEHGMAEAWFNVRFNMNDENNVDMNYEGPVKINNYYVSNNYS